MHIIQTLFYALLLGVFGLIALYSVVRFAVRHALEDADRRRATERRQSGF
ncbi:hypothetical protein ACI2K4_11075 [Micromonospora sp. NPDC050397]